MNIIQKNASQLGCVDMPIIEAGSILDAFEDPYCYRKLSEDEAIVFSSNYFYIK